MEEVGDRLEPALARLEGKTQLYVAASRDAMVSTASVKALFDLAREPKTFSVIESDHTNAGENARSEILQWLNRLHPK